MRKALDSPCYSNHRTREDVVVAAAAKEDTFDFDQTTLAVPDVMTAA